MNNKSTGGPAFPIADKLTEKEAREMLGYIDDSLDGGPVAKNFFSTLITKYFEMEKEMEKLRESLLVAEEALTGKEK